MAQSTASTSHRVYSWVSSCFSSLRMLLGLSLYISCHQVNCCQCTKLFHFLTCTGIHCGDSHCENGLVRWCLYTPRRLQQTAVSCKRSNCNKIKNLENRTSEGFVQTQQTTGLPVLSCRFARELIRGSWAPPGIGPLPPTGGRTRWLVPFLILPEWHWPELLFSRFFV